MTRFIRFILGHRALVSVGLLLSLAFALYSARRIHVRFQFRDFYDYADNPRLPLYRQDIQEFGDESSYLVAMVQADDVFSPDVLGYVRRLTQTLERNKVFMRVRSLTNVEAIRAHGDEVASGPLLPDGPVPENDRKEMREFALQSALISRHLISKDGQASGVLAEMRTPAALSTIDEQRRAIDVVRRAVQESRPPANVRVGVTGLPVVDVGVTDALTKDQMVLMPAVVLLLVVMLFLTFRTFHGILLCMSAVGVATLWTAGIFALFGRPVDIIGSTIPTAILVYGVVDPIFVLTRVLQKVNAGLVKDDAIVEAFSELALPCLLTSLTTAVGFAVFVGATAPTIRYFGITVAFGVLLAWLTSVTVLPLLLALTPMPKARNGAGRAASQLDHAFTLIWRQLQRRPQQVLVVTGIVLVAGTWLARKQHINNEFIGELPTGETRDTARAMEQKLSGVMRVSVHLDGKVDSMRQPALLKAIERVEHGMGQDALVTHSSSLADLVGEANQAFQGGSLGERRVPTSVSLVAQYLALINPVDLADFVTDDYSRSHIDFLLQDAGSEAVRTFVVRLRRVVESAGLDALGVKAELTGNCIVAYGELDGVVKQIIYGFVTAFGGIVLLEWLVFRSLRIALISVVPNLVPVVACFLTLRACDIPLKIESALVLCISIGGLFNTTIHFAARALQRKREAVETADEVMLHALRAIGPAALFTAITLSAGFAVLLLSKFSGLRALGLLSMITLLTGFVSDTIITPVLIRLGLNWGASVATDGPVLTGEAATVDVMPE